jgi:ferric-dicitrate binding protein FerR (iron transport regulator)
MRLTYLICVLVCLALAGAMVAADQLGTVTAKNPVSLNGDILPASAARGLPLAAGDEVETTDQPAVILLKDGSRVVVNERSAVKVVKSGGVMQVGLRSGAIRFSTTANSTLRVCALSRLIFPAAPSDGSVTIEGPDKVEARAEKGSVRVDENMKCDYNGQPATHWLGEHKAVVIVVAGAAAGTVVGVAAASGGGPSVSPSKP